MKTLTYSLLLALGLLFLAVHYLVAHPTARIVVIVIAAVAFLLAAVFASLGDPWTPGGQSTAVGSQLEPGR